MLHFKPKDGDFWDAIPFYHDGTYHVFFLETSTTDDGNRCTHAKWGHAISKDLLHWEQLPTAVQCDKVGPDKDGCTTGSVIFAKEKYWLFYTGSCYDEGDYAPKRDQFRKTQPSTICLATSADSIHWEKHPGNPVLCRDTEKYAWGDWRDPYVFYHEEEKCYWMTITARVYDKSDGFGGCVALAKSDDLIHWKVFDPIYAPGNLYPPECTDVFKMGDFWYLIYSYELTRYCVGSSPAGPWHQVHPNTFDGRSLYAGKTLTDGKTRYLIGDICSRKGETDAGPVRGAGYMGFPRELIQAKDGTLYTKLPAVFERHFSAAKNINLADADVMAGDWTLAPHEISASSDVFSMAMIQGKYKKFYLEATLKTSPSTLMGGLYFYAGDFHQIPYQVSLDFIRGDVVFSQKYRGPNGERLGFNWANLKAGREVKIQIIVENSVVEIFIDKKFSLGSRGYGDPSPGRIGFFVENGAMTVKDVCIMPL